MFTILQTRRFNIFVQHLISIGFVLIIAVSCYYSTYFIGYRTVGLLLLMTISLSAMLFDILPVLVAATLSAFIWNFFFIPPTFTFHIDNSENLLMLLLYFVIASVHAVLTYKIRQEEKKTKEKEEKEASIKLYNTLLNSLSHELRTPISTIIGSVDTLQERKDKLSPENQNELLHQIEIAGLRLNRQVENLLNMSRLETGMLKPTIDWCDVTELVYDVIQKNSSSGTHSITCMPDEQLPLFKLDRGLIEQVLHNIIHNAIQYTPANTQINIFIKQQVSACILIIQDNGNGIPEAEHAFVFEKFYRLPDSKTGGSGLGLSIVKGFIEAHKGSIAIKNNPSGGLICTIVIPAEASYVNHLNNE